MIAVPIIANVVYTSAWPVNSPYYPTQLQFLSKHKSTLECAFEIPKCDANVHLPHDMVKFLTEHESTYTQLQFVFPPSLWATAADLSGCNECWCQCLTVMLHVRNICTCTVYTSGTCWWDMYMQIDVWTHEQIDCDSAAIDYHWLGLASCPPQLCIQYNHAFFQPPTHLYSSLFLSPSVWCGTGSSVTD